MRKYTLRTSPEGWCTGLTGSGLRVLMGIDWNAMVCILFTSDGDFAECIERPFDHDGNLIDKAITVPPLHLSEIGGHQIEEKFQAWVDETIEEVCPISIKDYGHPSRFISVAALPAEYEDYRDDPSSVEADEAEDLEEQIAEWEKSGKFVFWWNEEYWCDPDGLVIDN